MRAGDLTTLERVKTYLAIGATDVSADGVLALFITSQSRFFRSQVGGRDFIYQKYVETRDGNGLGAIEPYQAPVVSGDSVAVDAVTIPQQPATVAGSPPQYGWVLTNDRFEIDGPWACLLDDYGPYSITPARFRRGRGNVVLTYWAGFLVSGEAVTVPATPYQVQSIEPAFVADYGVKDAGSGVALVKVASAPIANQYSVDSNGLYQFAAADAGRALLRSYSYVPADVEEAVWELVAWRYRERERTGQRSKDISGTLVTYQVDAIPPSVQPTIDKYTRFQV